MMTVHITCEKCGSAIDVYPNKEADAAQCNICHHIMEVNFNEEHEQGLLKDCPVCARKDFYSQKDFNRKVGVALFILASILSIWTYGVSFIVLYAVDFFLFRGRVVFSAYSAVFLCAFCGKTF